MINNNSTFQQIPIALSYPQQLTRENFVASACNQEALSWIDAYPNGAPVVVIYGEKGCGKTHLASIFSPYHLDAMTLRTDFILNPNYKKIVVENIDVCQNEEALFHLYNQAIAQKASVLMTARALPQFTLQDIKSRINSVPKIAIKMPDDELIKKVLKKAFLSRQIILDEAVLDFALPRIERSFAFIQTLIEKIDYLSLVKNQKITIPLVKTAIEELHTQK